MVYVVCTWMSGIKNYDYKLGVNKTECHMAWSFGPDSLFTVTFDWHFGLCPNTKQSMVSNSNNETCISIEICYSLGAGLDMVIEFLRPI